MADHGWDDVPYGHFGSASYDLEEHSWKFRLAPENIHPLIPLGVTTTIAHSTVPGDEESSKRTTEVASLRHGRHIKAVVRRNPELQPTASLLRPFLQASEAVENATSRHDPVKGELLTFGRVNDQATRRPTRLVAFPAGPSGSDVRIVQVQLQRQGWEETRDSWLEVPTLAGEETIWQSAGSPVQQIAFAQPVEAGETLLAVRSFTRTTILKPVLRQHGPTRLDLSLMLILPTEQTGGDPHADVAFNPWFTRQFAVIDQSARWCIWEFETSRSASAKCTRASSPSERTGGPLRALNDGWARVTWVGNPNTLLVVDRRNASIFNISAGSRERQDVDVRLSEGPGWILDVAILTQNLDTFCILTTSHLFYFAMKDEDGELHAQLKARVRHFRSPEDLTMRLSVLKETGGRLLQSSRSVHKTDNQAGSIVTLRSALVPSMTVYRLSLDDADTLTFQEPFVLEMSSDCSDEQAFARLSSFNLQTVEYVNKKAQRHGDGFSSVDKQHSKFVLATSLAADLSVHQSVYISTSGKYENPLKAPTWKGKLPTTASRLRSDELDFDDDIDVLGAELAVAPVPAILQRRRIAAQGQPRSDWTVDYRLSVQQLSSQGPNASSVESILNKIRGHMADTSEKDFKPLQTLREMTDGELAIVDIDQASDLVAGLGNMEAVNTVVAAEDGDAVSDGVGSLTRLVEALRALGAEAGHHENLATTYDSIVAQWISNLPDNIIPRIRLAKEQLARRMAAEVTLASYVVRYQVTESERSEQDKPEQQSQTWKLPVRENGAREAQSNFSTAPQALSQSQNVLPTPSPTATPSITTASSRTSFTSAEVSRLSKYTTFSKPAPSALPRSLDRILSHWELGADPETYDWLNTSRHITQQLETEEADSQLTERERARLQRKAERHIRRQRKENAASQQQHLASSQMPELVVSASQPGPVKIESQPSARPGSAFTGVAGSSQSQMPGVASQAVAGKFGGRPPLKKRRKQGF